MAKKIDLSDHLREARKRRGMSAAQVADMVGVSITAVYLWEAGRTRPRPDNLTALCKALRLPIRATRVMAAA